MAAGEIPEAAITLRHEACNASHHSSGSCSAQPGWGWVVRYVVAAKETGRPARSKMAARTLSVPKSMPRR